jgi:hypothetical protein
MTGRIFSFCIAAIVKSVVFQPLRLSKNGMTGAPICANVRALSGRGGRDRWKELSIRSNRVRVVAFAPALH